MKNILLVCVLLAGFFKFKASVLVVEGRFQNKNIIIQNSIGTSGAGFCATEIKVNGQITTDEVNSSAFEVDLAAMKIIPGQKVIIEIIHKSDCIPVILNPEVLKPKATFDILDLKINPSGILTWVTKNENGALPFIVEQFKWNKWVQVGLVSGIGNPDVHEYTFQVSTHSGENKFRIKQLGLESTPRVSSAVTINTQMAKPSFMLTKDNDKIQFTTETCFEMYDTFGILVKKGFGIETDITNCVKGKYYLSFDNQTIEFEKKK